MDALTLLIGAAFYVLFAVSIRRYLLHRGALELAVVLVFSSTAAIFAVAIVNRLLPVLTPGLGPLAVTLLVAQPVLMVHLVTLIVRLPRWAMPVATGEFILAVGGYYLGNRSVGAVLFLVGYFALTEVAAACVLILEGRRRHGFPRIRLITAGGASILFGMSIFVAGLGSAARGTGAADPEVLVLSRLLALVAGVGYLAAFVPPRWLRDIGHRALAFDLVRSIVSSPTGTEPRVLWDALAAAATNILGTHRVRIVATDGTVLAVDGAGSASATTDPTSADAAHRMEVDLVSEGRPIATLTARLDGRPLFLEDDLALIGLLGSLTARAVGREEAVARLREAARALDEARAIRVSEERFRALLDAEPNAILSIDPGGRIRWATRSAGELFGAAEANLVGHRLDEVVAPRNEARLYPTTTVGVTRYETVGTRADGTTFPAEIALSEFEFEGEPSRMAVVTDITWRHDADAIRDRFIGVLSHELRTPITLIFGGTQVLLRRGAQLDPETRDELLADVASESERLQRMIENLLILARVERGAEPVEVVPLLVHRILPEVVAREQANWPAMSITIQVQPDLPLVAGDEGSLVLILRNLISNAGKYAGPNATVRIAVETDASGAVAVRVQDNGPGIEPTESDALFGLYFRSTSSASAPGSGIGLFVCRHLVAAMGGRMWAKAGPEGGAEFGFTLPVWVEDRDLVPDAPWRTARTVRPATRDTAARERPAPSGERAAGSAV